MVIQALLGGVRKMSSLIKGSTSRVKFDPANHRNNDRQEGQEGDGSVNDRCDVPIIHIEITKAAERLS